MVVSEWFGWSALWLLPLGWRLVSAVFFKSGRLLGQGSIRLWLGSLIMLCASSGLEATLRAGEGASDVVSFGQGIASVFSGLFGVLLLCALAAVAFPWLFGYGTLLSLFRQTGGEEAAAPQGPYTEPRMARGPLTEQTPVRQAGGDDKSVGRDPSRRKASWTLPSPVAGWDAKLRQRQARSSSGNEKAPARTVEEWAPFERIRPTSAMRAKEHAAQGAPSGTAAGKTAAHALQARSSAALPTQGAASGRLHGSSGGPSLQAAAGSGVRAVRLDPKRDARSAAINTEGISAASRPASPRTPAAGITMPVNSARASATVTQTAMAATHTRVTPEPVVVAARHSAPIPTTKNETGLPPRATARPVCIEPESRVEPQIKAQPVPVPEHEPGYAITPAPGSVPAAQGIEQVAAPAQARPLERSATWPYPAAEPAVSPLKENNHALPPAAQPADAATALSLLRQTESGQMQNMPAPESRFASPRMPVQEITSVPAHSQDAAAASSDQSSAQSQEHAVRSVDDQADLLPQIPAIPSGIVQPDVGPETQPETPAAPLAPVTPAPSERPRMLVPSDSFAFQAPHEIDVELPGLDLLDADSADTIDAPPIDIADTARLIEQRLKEFKVPVTVLGAYSGPVITRFEIEPAVGVRGAQIVGLMKDLSRALGLTSIRVVETIPGKTCMGLELPNAQRQTIRLSAMLESDAYRDSASHLTLAMGKDITGVPVVTDLARAPHMLVAGTTGSGKSVAINAMILSLLYKSTPADVRMIMIDPKMLELSVYDGIPHLLAPVVTDMKLAANALSWCVNEMDKRYRLMSALGVRNLAGFNQKIRDGIAAERKVTNPFSLTPDAPEPLAPLPMIVVVIDELADLMMVAGKKIEELIARLAQKARAAGIHLILATQRPSVDVITGLIKANIPTRVAFQVSSKIDSRTVLDQMGAESLLGHGDMLFLPPGSGYPQRVHGAFVSDEEVHRVVEHLKQFGEPEYEEAILAGTPNEEPAPDAAGGEGGNAEADPLYDEAVAFVIRTRRASISSVQRQLRIGYNRAARMVEQMEVAGILSPMASNGSRDILVPPGAE